MVKRLIQKTLNRSNHQWFHRSLCLVADVIWEQPLRAFCSSEHYVMFSSKLSKNVETLIKLAVLTNTVSKVDSKE